MDPLAEFKAAQRKGWASFAPLAAMTGVSAAKLVRFARVRPGQRLLDVACGTGVVAITAARTGAIASGLDLTPELLEQARANAELASVSVELTEGDAEALPYEDASFDVVVSQFGHMFAPRAEVATRELLRVLKPGGTVAFSTWPPELLIGRMFALTFRYAGPPPPGVAPPSQWGDPGVVRERLGERVRELTFDRGTMLVPALSPAHHRAEVERFAAPVRRFVDMEPDPVRLAQFRREYDALVEEYLEANQVRQDYLLTRAIKV